MALDANALATTIATTLKASDASTFGAAHAQAMGSFYDFVASGVANAVVAHFQSNAVVSPIGVPPMTANGIAVLGTGKVT
jgi:hypothetical protein